MDYYAIERFCDRWIEKSNVYRSNELEDLFDRFFTLFVAYNRLYSTWAVMYRTQLNERVVFRFQGDRCEATTLMELLIRQTRFSTKATENIAIGRACERIATLLQQQHFFLHANRKTREPDFEKDRKLSEGLYNLSLKSVLDCLYQIRCNIFHGEKEFAPRQAELLMPANELLEIIVFLSRDALREKALENN